MFSSDKLGKLLVASSDCTSELQSLFVAFSIEGLFKISLLSDEGDSLQFFSMMMMGSLHLMGLSFTIIFFDSGLTLLISLFSILCFGGVRSVLSFLAGLLFFFGVDFGEG